MGEHELFIFMIIILIVVFTIPIIIVYIYDNTTKYFITSKYFEKKSGKVIYYLQVIRERYYIDEKIVIQDVRLFHFKSGKKITHKQYVLLKENSII